MSTLNDSIIKLSQILIDKKWKLVTAESCTGGGVAYHLTNIPGSSAWFERGFVTYSNAAKEELLHVKQSVLAEHGAVSEPVAKEMANGALKNSHAQVSLAITGIAGPDGGTPQKPVGTVWFAWAAPNKSTQTQLVKFTGSRIEIREQAIHVAIDALILFLTLPNPDEKNSSGLQF
jgi:nicotinamide-nucleotide amidase